MIKDFTVLSLFLLGSAIVSAQPVKDYKEMSLEELMDVEVTSVSRTKEKLSEAPAMVYVILAQDIQERGYVTILDVLEDIPEFELHENSSAEIHNGIVTRGVSGQDHLVFLHNGARISSGAATLHNVDHNYDIRTAERIEIVVGPASAVYGADAFSGVINIITPRGADIKGTRISTSYGSFGTTNASAQAGWGNADLAVSAGGSFYNSREPYLPKYYKNEYAWYTNQYANNALVQVSPLAPSTAVINTGAAQPWDNGRTGYTGYIKANLKAFEVGYYQSGIKYSSSNGVRPEYAIYSKDAKYGFSIRSYFVRHAYKSRNDKFTAEHNFSTCFYGLNSESSFINSFTGYNKGYKYAYNNTVLFNGIYSQAFNANNKLTFGLSARHIVALPKTSDLPYAFNPGLSADEQGLYYIGTNIQNDQGVDLTLPQAFYHYRQISYGLFAQYQGNIQNKFFMTIGGRADYDTRTGLAFNPRIGAVYKASSSLRFAFNYDEAFLNPSPENLYGQFGSFQLNQSGTALESAFYNAPNPDLQPQKIRAIDLLGQVIAGDLSVSFDGYYSNLINTPRINGRLNGVFDGIPVGFLQFTENVGTIYTYGGTIKLDYRKSFDDLKINAYTYYSYSNGQSNDEGGLVLSSLHNVKAGINTRWRKLSSSLRLTYRSGSQPAHEETGAEPVKTPGYVKLNLYAQYRLVEPKSSNGFRKFTVDAFLRINNLTNARYYNSSFQPAADVFLDTPQDPIRITLGAIIGIGRSNKF